MISKVREELVEVDDNKLKFRLVLKQASELDKNSADRPVSGVDYSQLLLENDIGIGEEKCKSYFTHMPVAEQTIEHALDLQDRVARSKESKKRLFEEIQVLEEERRIKNARFDSILSSTYQGQSMDVSKSYE